MKKISALIVSLFLILGLTACSKNEDKNASIQFFNALHNTMEAKSGRIAGSILMDSDEPSEITLDLYYDQTNDLELAITTGLEANGNTQPNFLDFYIKDGKTYLNSLGTKTSSSVEKIGLAKDSKLGSMDPFLDLNDTQKKEWLTNAKVEGDTYSFDIDKTLLSNMLDSYGSVSIERAKLKAKIQNDRIDSLSIDIKAKQSINKNQIDTSIKVELQASEYGQLKEVPFPTDLNTYKNEG